MARDPRRSAARALDRALHPTGRHARHGEDLQSSGAPLDALIDVESRGLSEADLALCRELVFGTVRWLRRLDIVIEAASGRRLRQVDRRLLAPLRLGVYQLLFLDRVPPYAAVNEAVAEGRRRAGARAAGFVNGVLRRIAERPVLDAWPVESGDPAVHLALAASHPDWLVRRWLARWGADATRELLTANNAPRALQLLAFADRGGPAALAAGLAEEGIETEPSGLSELGLVVRRGSPFTSRAFGRGDFYLQDSASQVAAWMPRPRAGERVLDLHAAPGGKSFALLAAEPSVRLVAADRSPSRLRRLRANQQRLGRPFPVLVGEGSAPPFAPASFDRVLLDLPCSGTGTIRQHPELKWRLSGREIERLARQGRLLLEAAAPLARRGGLVVVVTCSLEPEENEEMVDGFLADHPGYRLRDLGPGLSGVGGGALAAGLFGGGRWRLPTSAEHDGFTVQAIDRVS
jgi:16S rRNA (cytosine967-C5)-methyltransferase